MLLEYARQQGYEVCGIYCDEDYSGADRDRPAFNRMLAAASRHEFEIILAKTQSRFTRDMELVESYLHGRLAEWGVRFIAVLDHADTADPAGKKSRQINGLVNEWYLEDLSGNVRSVLTHKRREGRYIASFALYGYQKDPLDPGRLVVDPEAAAVVQKIFALYLAGNGITRITQLLNRQGIPPPARYKQLRGIPCRGGAGLWGRATIHQMLQNRTYMGDLVQGRHKRVSYKSKKTVWLPKEQWIVVPGTHEPVIDPGIFMQVQQLMAGRARGGGSGRLHPLAGRVVCGVCGGVMEQTGAGGRHYFRCRMPLRAPGACAGQPYLPAEALEGLVLARIRHHAAKGLDPAGFAQSAARRRAEEEGRAKKAGLARLQAAAARCGRALQQLYLDRCEGLVSPEQFARLNAAFLARQAELEQQCARLAADLLAEPDPAGPAAEWQARLQKAASLETLDRALVSLLLQKAVVYPPEKEGPDPRCRARQIELVWNF